MTAADHAAVTQKNLDSCVSLTNEKASVLTKHGVTERPENPGPFPDRMPRGPLVERLILLVVLPRNIDKKSKKTAEEAVSAAWRTRFRQGGTYDCFGFRFPGRRIFSRQSAMPKHARARGLPTFSVCGRPVLSLHCQKSEAFSNGVNLDCHDGEWYKRCRQHIFTQKETLWKT